MVGVPDNETPDAVIDERKREEGEEDRRGESEYGDLDDDAVLAGDDPVDVEEDEDRAEPEHTNEEP